MSKGDKKSSTQMLERIDYSILVFTMGFSLDTSHMWLQNTFGVYKQMMISHGTDSGTVVGHLKMNLSRSSKL